MNEKRVRRTRGSGSLFRKPGSRTFVLQHYKDDPATGRRIRTREYTGVTSREEAQKLLNTRLYQIDRGEQFDTRRTAARISDLIAGLRDDIAVNGRSPRALKGMEWRWKHLEKPFGGMLAANLTTEAVRAYARQRREEGAEPAMINRELSTLRRAFNLGRRSTPPRVRTVPYIPLLREQNTRKGFVEDSDFDRLKANASELWLRTLLEVAYTYGWRIGELLGLRVRHVNLATRTLRLDPGTTKNGEGREVVMTDAVAELLKAAIANKRPDDPLFTWGGSGRRAGRAVQDFRRTWANLCVSAGLGRWECRRCGEPIAKGTHCEEKGCGGRRKYRGLIVHDLRRSAAKAARRAGVPESVVMKMMGHKTPAMFRRYAIVSTADQRAAVEALERARASISLAPVKPPLAPEPTPTASQRANGRVQ